VLCFSCDRPQCISSVLFFTPTLFLLILYVLFSPNALARWYLRSAAADVDAFALLKEDLKDDDMENVIASVNRLLTVGTQSFLICDDLSIFSLTHTFS
jgi:hypothetical protein